MWPTTDPLNSQPWVWFPTLQQLYTAFLNFLPPKPWVTIVVCVVTVTAALLSSCICLASCFLFNSSLILQILAFFADFTSLMFLPPDYPLLSLQTWYSTSCIWTSQFPASSPVCCLYYSSLSGILKGTASPSIYSFQLALLLTSLKFPCKFPTGHHAVQEAELCLL